MREVCTYIKVPSSVTSNYNSNSNCQGYNLSDVGEEPSRKPQGYRVMSLGKISNVKTPITVESEVMELPWVTLRCKPTNLLKAYDVQAL